MPRLCSCGMADEPPRLPDAPGDYGPAGRSPWLDVDWRAHQRWVDVDGRRGQRHRAGRGRPPIVFIHGLVGLVAELARAAARLRRATTASSRSTCPASASRDAARRRSRSPATGASSTRCSTSSASSARRRRRQLDGRLHRRRARDPVPRARSSASCSSAPPGCRSSTSATSASLGGLRRARATAWPPTAAGSASRSDALARRPRARRALMRLVAAHARPAARPAGRRAGPRLGQARLRRRPRRADRLPDPRPARRDRLPDADRLGRGGPLVPVRDADEFERLIPDARKVVWPRHRARGDARAPGGVQRAARGVPGRGRRASEVRRARPSRRRGASAAARRLARGSARPRPPLSAA